MKLSEVVKLCEIGCSQEVVKVVVVQVDVVGVVEIE